MENAAPAAPAQGSTPSQQSNAAPQQSQKPSQNGGLGENPGNFSSRTPAKSATSEPKEAPQQKASQAQPKAPQQPRQTGEAPTKSQESTTEAPQRETPQQEEMFDVVVNKQKIRMSRQELLDNASMGAAATAKWQEAAKAREFAENHRNKLKTDPIAALFDPELGLTKPQIQEAIEKWYSKEVIEEESLTLEQKRLRDAEDKVKKYEEQERIAKQKQEEEHLGQLTQKHRDYFQGKVIEALEASDYPKEPYFVSRIAFYMNQARKNCWDAPLDHVVRQVQKETTNIVGTVTKNATTAQLRQILGKETVDRILRDTLEDMRSKKNLPPASATPKQTANPRANGHDKISSAEVQRRLRDIRLGILE